jgi:excisionase family DNA binding protein
MYEPKFLDELAKEIAKRLSAMESGGNGGSHGNGRPPASNGGGKVAKRVFTIDEASVYIGRSVPALYRLVHRREIPYTKHGRALRFLKDDLDRWLESDRV